MSNRFIPVTIESKGEKVTYWLNFQNVVIMLRDKQDERTFLFFDAGRTIWYKVIETPQEINKLIEELG